MCDRIEAAQLEAVIARSQPNKEDSYDPPPLPGTGVSPARLQGARDRADGTRAIEWVDVTGVESSDGTNTSGITGTRNMGNYEIFI